MACSKAILLAFISCIFMSKICTPNALSDTLWQGEQLRDWEQLVSAGGVFRLGFFSPDPQKYPIGSSGPRHVGIWFDRIPTYSVWVANRVDPVPDSSGALTLDANGKLKVTFQGSQPILINPSMAATKISSDNIFTATLLDSGNLVIRQVNSDKIPGLVLWQSFDYPHNMLLPGMKLGMDLKTGQNWTLTSWQSDNIPTAGAFRLGLDPTGANQLLIWRRDDVYWSSGVWKNGSFGSAADLTKRTDVYDFRFVSTEEEKYFTYSIKNKSVLSRWDLNTIGEITLFTLDERDGTTHWIFDTTSACKQDLKNSTAVCISEKPTKCRKESDVFVAHRGYYNEIGDVDFGSDLTQSDCHRNCWRNCTCVAYKYYEGSGCQYWTKGSNFVPDEALEYVYLLTAIIPLH